jgi:hypothetical protein
VCVALNALGGGVSRPGSLVVIVVIEARCTPSATQKLFLSNKGVRTAPIALNALTGGEILTHKSAVEVVGSVAGCPLAPHHFRRDPFSGKIASAIQRDTGL